MTKFFSRDQRLLYGALTGALHASRLFQVEIFEGFQFGRIIPHIGRLRYDSKIKWTSSHCPKIEITVA